MDYIHRSAIKYIASCGAVGCTPDALWAYLSENNNIFGIQNTDLQFKRFILNELLSCPNNSVELYRIYDTNMTIVTFIFYF